MKPLLRMDILRGFSTRPQPSPSQSMPAFSWFFCPKHGLLRASQNRWRCPMCDHILTKLTCVEAFQMKHGETYRGIIVRRHKQKPKRHYTERERVKP